MGDHKESPIPNPEQVRSYNKAAPGIFIFNHLPPKIRELVDQEKPLVFPAKKMSDKIVVLIGKGKLIESAIK